MKRLLTTVLAAGALMLAAVPAADASVPCSAFRYEINNSGYAVELDHFRADGMNCASVRYVSRFLGRKLSRQYGWPRLGGPYWDGWVSWRCHSRGGRRWLCHEGTSGTSFSFRGTVYS